jgi:hypothetical protein
MAGYRASAADIGNVVNIVMHEDDRITQVRIVDFDLTYTHRSAGYQVVVVLDGVNTDRLIPFWIPVYMVSPSINP